MNSRTDTTLDRHRIRPAAVAFVGVLSFLCAWPAGAGTRLSVGGERGLPGTTVSVPLSLRGETNVTALQADILFDAARLSSGAPIPGAALGGHTLAASQPSNGVRRVVIYSLNNTLLSNGVLASFPFSIPSGAPGGVARLTITNVLVVKADATTVASTNTSGFVTSTPVFLFPDGHLEGFLSISAASADQCHVVQATTDFVNWSNVFTNAATGRQLEFVDPSAGLHPFRFYRAFRCN